MPSSPFISPVPERESVRSAISAVCVFPTEVPRNQFRSFKIDSIDSIFFFFPSLWSFRKNSNNSNISVDRRRKNNIEVCGYFRYGICA
ncbi:hypothetical protein PUN28_013445 [Cardiocondyla obscurior]|uniref:Uncharacterized protein n=1 Tax=Cardiocondyla obscurior TaxID=286306 RepID=A0AAW2F3G6_9HYME